jgi:hypothetical protein
MNEKLLMRCCCEQCLPDNPGRTYTDAYRHLKECEYLADMPSNEMRQGYLEVITKKRGAAVASRLRTDVWKLIKGADESGTTRLSN